MWTNLSAPSLLLKIMWAACCAPACFMIIFYNKNPKISNFITIVFSIITFKPKPKPIFFNVSADVSGEMFSTDTVNPGLTDLVVTKRICLLDDNSAILSGDY
jgi:hypothetical protein